MQITKTVGDLTLGFEWKGGTYVSVCRGSAFSRPKEVINVEAQMGKRPELSRENLHKIVNEWIASYGVDALIHDVTVNWPSY